MIADREGHIQIGVLTELTRYKIVTRGIPHRLDHARVLDPGADDELPHHLLAFTLKHVERCSARLEHCGAEGGS